MFLVNTLVIIYLKNTRFNIMVHCNNVLWLIGDIHLVIENDYKNTNLYLCVSFQTFSLYQNQNKLQNKLLLTKPKNQGKIKHVSSLEYSVTSYPCHRHQHLQSWLSLDCPSHVNCFKTEHVFIFTSFITLVHAEKSKEGTVWKYQTN